MADPALEYISTLNSRIAALEAENERLRSVGATMNERPTDALRSLVRHEQWAATPWEQEADALDARIAALESENERLRRRTPDA